MSRLDWEKDNRAHRYVPSVLAEPATQRQLDYILGLAHKKNQFIAHLPKTKRGAAETIDRLTALPDVKSAKWFHNGRAVGSFADRVAVETGTDTSRQEILVEIREYWPQLSPQTIASLVHLFIQVDDIGTLFVLDSLMHEDVPKDAGTLILHILERFLSEFGEVKPDDTDLAAG